MDVVHVPDLQAPVSLSQRAPGNASRLWTSVAAAVCSAGPPQGQCPAWRLFTVYRLEPRPFSDKQIALLQNFAAQAVIAIENARLLGELRERTDELAARNSEFAERIEHQSATISVLKEMAASPGDAQPVFDLITCQARELCGTPSAVLLQYDGELVHVRAMSGEGDGWGELLARYESNFPMVPTRSSLACRAILDGQIVHIRDLDGEPGIGDAIRALGHRTSATVPIMRDGRAIGAISTAALEVDAFSPSQIQLLQTFAEQAVISISSAETYRELRRRTSDLEVFTRIPDRDQRCAQGHQPFDL